LSNVPTENWAAYSCIILLIKTRVFTCIMAIYDIKDSVNTCKTSFTCVCTFKHRKDEKTQVVTPELWHLCVSFLVGISVKIILWIWRAQYKTTKSSFDLRVNIFVLLLWVQKVFISIYEN